MKMEFYEHRSDFLRFEINKEVKGIDYLINLETDTPEEIQNIYNTYKDCLLPVDKFQLENSDIFIGEQNIVTGSTCFFVKTGDLFIARRYKREDSPYDFIRWYKVGIEDEDEKYEYYTGDNPYYEESSSGVIAD